MNNEHTGQGGLDKEVREQRGSRSRRCSHGGAATAAGIEGEERVLESLNDQRGIMKAPLHKTGDGE
jgi:hypothetical protein